MGTSSILAGAVISACWSAVGLKYSRSDLVHAVLVVEQLLTTGGGWQDQVGGLHPGINLGVSTNPGRRIKPSPLIGFFTSGSTNSFLLCFYSTPKWSCT